MSFTVSAIAFTLSLGRTGCDLVLYKQSEVDSSTLMSPCSEYHQEINNRAAQIDLILYLNDILKLKIWSAFCKKSAGELGIARKFFFEEEVQSELLDGSRRS